MGVVDSFDSAKKKHKVGAKGSVSAVSLVLFVLLAKLISRFS